MPTHTLVYFFDLDHDVPCREATFTNPLSRWTTGGAPPRRLSRQIQARLGRNPRCWNRINGGF